MGVVVVPVIAVIITWHHVLHVAVGVTWHEVLHVHGLLPLLVVLDADSCQGEEDGGAEGHADSDPADDVGPVVLEFGVL